MWVFQNVCRENGIKIYFSSKISCIGFHNVIFHDFFFLKTPLYPCNGEERQLCEINTVDSRQGTHPTTFCVSNTQYWKVSMSCGENSAGALKKNSQLTSGLATRLLCCNDQSPQGISSPSVALLSEARTSAHLTWYSASSQQALNKCLWIDWLAEVILWVNSSL